MKKGPSQLFSTESCSETLGSSALLKGECRQIYRLKSLNEVGRCFKVHDNMHRYHAVLVRSDLCLNELHAAAIVTFRISRQTFDVVQLEKRALIIHYSIYMLLLRERDYYPFTLTFLKQITG